MDMAPFQARYWRGKFLPQAQSGTPSTIILYTIKHGGVGSCHAPMVKMAASEQVDSV